MEPTNSTPRLGREPIPAGEVSGRVQVGQQLPNQSTRMGREPLPPEGIAGRVQLGQPIPAGAQLYPNQPLNPEPFSAQKPPHLPGQESRVRATSKPLPSEAYLQQPSSESPSLQRKDILTPADRARIISSSKKSGNKIAANPKLSAKVNPATRLAASKFVGKLNESIDKGHIALPFISILLVAIFKDAMDLVENPLILLAQGVPVLGQILGVVVQVAYSVVGLLLTAILYFFMQSQGWFVNQELKVLFWLIDLCDEIPLVEMLPLETISVLFVFNHIRRRAKKAKILREKVESMSAQEVQKLNSNFEEGLDAVQL